MITDPISDLFTRIRNAQAKKKPVVEVPHSKLKQSIVELMKKEGYIKSLFVTDDPPATKIIKITLKYDHDAPVIRSIKRVSRPGQRIYLKSKSLPRVLSGLGIAIVTTSKGLMTAHHAKASNIGGEVIGEIY